LAEQRKQLEKSRFGSTRRRVTPGHDPRASLRKYRRRQHGERRREEEISKQR
jgi:hypothetical protein